MTHHRREILLIFILAVSITGASIAGYFAGKRVGVASVYYMPVNVEDRPMWDTPIHAEVDTLINDTLYINWYGNNQK